MGMSDEKCQLPLNLFLKENVMKLKFLVASALLASSSVVLAQSSVTIGYADRTLDSNGQKVAVTGLSAKTRLFNQIDGDIGINQSRNTVSNSITDRTEVGLSTGYEVTSFAKATIRGAVGMKNVSGKQGVEYYSIEPGINVKLPVDGFTARVAYRYRDSFDVNDADRSNTMRYALSYDLTKKDRLTLGYEVLKGDGANKQTVFSYTRSF
jgi:hypothetical protein